MTLQNYSGILDLPNYSYHLIYEAPRTVMEAFIEFIALVKQDIIVIIHRHNTDIITMTERSLGICICQNILTLQVTINVN